jgi:ATP-dependent DNA helicase HFM1/MER3
MAQNRIGFHHAGLDMKDRGLVEKSFLEGNIIVLCCTSTLAIGVSLSRKRT